MGEKPQPPLMLKEWLELEFSAEHSRDGFGCYPRYLGGAAELRGSDGGGRDDDVIAKISAAIRVVLFRSSGREGALYRSFSRRLRGGFWKKRSGEGEETMRRYAASCAAAAACSKKNGSLPAMSPRRQSWEHGEAGAGGAVGGRCRHETEVLEYCNMGCNLEEEQAQQLSPVSILDFANQDEDEEDNESDSDNNGNDDDDDEMASPTFQQSLANIERARQELLQKIRQFEQLAELDTSELDEGPTSTEDPRCHVAECNFTGGDVESGLERGLLGLLEASPGSTQCFQKLLMDFFHEGSDGEDRVEPSLEAARAWMNGRDHSLRFERKAELEEIERHGRWRCFHEDELEPMAVELESGIFWSLVGELVGELCR